MSGAPVGTRDNLIATAQALMRRKGYSATRVEEICQAAGVTKGAFFHHFRSKDDLAVQALTAFVDERRAQMAGPWASHDDPVARLLGYLEHLYERVLDMDVGQGCLIAVFTQELSFEDPKMRDRVVAAFDEWTALVKALVDDALAARPCAEVDSHSLAGHMVASVEGALLVAKARQDREPVRETLMHLRRYVGALFGR